MSEEPKKDQEIDAILSDLDVILSDIADPAGRVAAPPPAPVVAPIAAQAAPAPAPAPIPAPAAAPKIELAPPAKTPEPAPPAAPVTPAAAPPPPAEPALKIELAPREGLPPAKKAEPAPAAAPKPAGLSPVRPPEITAPAAAAPAPPAAAPAPALAPKPAPAVAPAPAPAPAPVAAAAPDPAPAAAGGSLKELGSAIPEKTPRDQIRRVAFLYAPAVEKECVGLAAFLDKSALTVSKKPLFLRKVMVESVGAACDPAGIAARMGQVKAVAAIIIADASAEAKVRELQDALSTAGLALHVVAPAEIQKRSVAVDIIVDLMLLSGEA